ncbi:DUF998 domain-containing protein [Acrocarpospora catenulata]|uniref:DUF998 domain-containing protein n=1 Tax=Acrocarpospora catenulata TaxID=2836182 RepID=UPI001BD9232E|nr:DUF998 domain-containing protein [Acrocarpospora catenulata]
MTASPRTTLSPAVTVTIAAVDLLVLALFHLLRPDVDPLTRPTSEYALGDFGVLAGPVTALVGIGALALAWALWSGPGARAAAIVLAVFGVAKVVQAFFPIDAPGTSTTTGLVHNVLGNVAFLALPLAAGLAARALRPAWRAAPIAAAVLVVTVLALLASDLHGAFGIAQRLYLVACSAWMLLAAVALRSRASWA